MNIHIPISMINSIHAHRFIYTLHNSPYIVLNQAKKVVFSFLFFFFFQNTSPRLSPLGI